MKTVPKEYIELVEAETALRHEIDDLNTRLAITRQKHKQVVGKICQWK